jgi:hypothetical protein
MRTLEVRIGLAEYSGCRHYEDLLSLALEDLKTTDPKANAIPQNSGPFHTV